MSVYHLSYDVKDSDETKNNEFRKRITKAIIEKLTPGWIKRPVATTIFFACSHDIDSVMKVLYSAFSNEAFYVITQSKVNSDDKVVMSWLPNEDLESNFADECAKIKADDGKY